MQRKSRLIRTQERLHTRRTLIFIVGGFALLFFAATSAIKVSSMLSERIEDKTRPETSQNLVTASATIKISTSNTITNEKEIIIKGTSNPGDTIEIKVNKTITSELIANSSGKFQKTVKLKEGENIITAQSNSNKSNSITVILDSEPPELTILNPENNSTINKNEVVIEGETEKESKIKINDRVAIVKNTGTFSLNYTLNEGANEFIIISTDKAGNQTEKTTTIIYSP